MSVHIHNPDFVRQIKSAPSPGKTSNPSLGINVHDLAMERDLKLYKKCDGIADQIVSLFIELTNEISPRSMDEREMDFVGKMYEAALAAAIVRLA